MSTIKNDILKQLNQLKGSGKFACMHKNKFVFPGLTVQGLGELAYPINEMQAKALIQSAQQAAFGIGNQTVYDNNVRKTSEIEASKLEFTNKDWEKFIDKALENIKEGLGLEDYTITANLYKLLIYKTGDFFLPHKDTEKEKGMFGTMIVGLPSSYTGGQL